MLVLSRKIGEKLIIDHNITVEVVRVKGNRVTLGIAAPQDVKILRDELYQRPINTSQPSSMEVVVEDGLLQAC